MKHRSAESFTIWKWNQGLSLLNIPTLTPKMYVWVAWGKGRCWSTIHLLVRRHTSKRPALTRGPQASSLCPYQAILNKMVVLCCHFFSPLFGILEVSANKILQMPPKSRFLILFFQVRWLNCEFLVHLEEFFVLFCFVIVPLSGC